MPDKAVETWDDYKKFKPQGKPCHVAQADMPLQFIKEQLDQVRGHLVNMPLNFLERADMKETDASVNFVTLE